jgi:hypothetical protein
MFHLPQDTIRYINTFLDEEKVMLNPMRIVSLQKLQQIKPPFSGGTNLPKVTIVTLRINRRKYYTLMVFPFYDPYLLMYTDTFYVNFTDHNLIQHSCKSLDRIEWKTVYKTVI